MTTAQQIEAGLKKIRNKGLGNVRVTLPEPRPRYPHKLAYKIAADLGMEVKVRVIGSDLWMFPKNEVRP